MEFISIVSKVKREMDRKRINAADLSLGLHMPYQSVFGMLNRETIQVQRLAELSEFLQYNFFRELAQELPYREPDYSQRADQNEVVSLHARVKELELEVSILRQTLKDVVGR
jgi:hypothetical protein